IFLYLTLYFMFKKGVGKFFSLSMSDPRLIASFLFALIFAVAVGSSTPNFGALSRYKIPCMPFYLLVLFIIYHKAGLAYPKFVQRILKLIP
ncbi:MAG: hypothetical protein JSU05_13065, partial [Bacteroidetes bacterium]|nr:hypothetical protein [Bacteroidota bacterium]